MIKLARAAAVLAAIAALAGPAARPCCRPCRPRRALAPRTRMSGLIAGFQPVQRGMSPPIA